MEEYELVGIWQSYGAGRGLESDDIQVKTKTESAKALSLIVFILPIPSPGGPRFSADQHSWRELHLV